MEPALKCPLEGVAVRKGSPGEEKASWMLLKSKMDRNQTTCGGSRASRGSPRERSPDLVLDPDGTWTPLEW